MRLIVAPVRGMGFALAVALVLSSLDIRAGHAAELAEQIKLCDFCHGADNLPRDSDMPIIAGQEFYYLYVQLKDYKSGLRSNPIMGAIAKGFSKEELQRLAQHYAEREWTYTGYRSSDGNEEEAQQGLVAGQCVQCHLGGYEGNSRIPRLAGQQRDYLERTMLEFKNKVRMNSPAKSTLMSGYDDARIAAMADYLGGL